MLLRPPGFGKTTILSMLYYDVRGANDFARRFGSLAVVTEAHQPIPRHSQHLCLSFILSNVLAYSDIVDSTSHLASHISCVVHVRLSNPETFLRDEDGKMIAKVFKLVRAHGYTLFVGVDDYDCPTRLRSAQLPWTPIEQSLATPRDLEQVVDTRF